MVKKNIYYILRKNGNITARRSVKKQEIYFQSQSFKTKRKKIINFEQQKTLKSMSVVCCPTSNTLNYEERVHGINMLPDKTKSNDYNAEHKEYYGQNCNDCKDNYSPDDNNVLTDPKYRNSKAYKNFYK